LEYTSPESLPSPQTGLLRNVDSKSDMWSLGMILHRMLFFNLPYTYASDGDRGSAAGEADKMERLEKEVLNYPGFKSTIDVEAKLKARKLSKNYLVLLESLLCVTPSTRPTCERVLGGIREGKLDPSSSDQIGDSSTTSLIPISLRKKVEQPLTALASPSHQLDERQPEVIRIPSMEKMPPSRDQKPLLPSLSPSVPTSSSSLTMTGKSGRRGSGHDDDSKNGAWSWSMALTSTRVVHIRIPKALGMRSLKSFVLIAKVFTLSNVCSKGCNIHPIATCIILGLAVIDTWFDGLKVSAVLALLHALFVRFGGVLCTRCT